MKNELCSVLVLVTCLALLAVAPEEKVPKPQYDQKGQLIRPADYREWMFLSAGYGMNYSPGPTATKCLPMFLCSAGLSTLVATGRNPNTEGLGLELTGVDLTDRGYIKVNERLQTTAPGVWAIGEVT